MGDNDVITFDEPPLPSRTRETVALAYVKKILSRAAPEAVRFQRNLMNDDKADPNLRFKASESLLDRFVGKASQEIKLSAAETRPLVFNSKLQILKEGMKAAEDAHTTSSAPVMEAFTDAIMDRMSDREGVTI